MNQMKCSQSMSSLESPPKYLRTPEGTRKPCNKICYSLSSKKSRHTFDKQMWRRSWGSYEENDDHLMDQCGYEESMIKDASADSSLRQFLEDYTEICDWLNAVQIQRGRSADARKLSELGTEVWKRQPWRVKINERVAILLKSFPLLKEECGWRIRHLNSQWDALEKILLCQSLTVSAEVESSNGNGNIDGVEWLREWLCEMENKLQPLDFRTQWTSELLQRQVEHHKELQAEIEEKSGKVHEALRGFSKRESAKKKRLENRWCQLRLRILEWVQHLAGVQDKLCNTKQGSSKDNCFRESVWSSDDETAEPLTKYRRLGIGGKQEEGGEPQFVPSSNSFPEVGGLVQECSNSPKALLQLAEDIHLDLTKFCELDANEDVIMGQSHDSEGGFKQNGSPLPKSVMEFIFEESPTTPTSTNLHHMSGSSSSINSNSGSSSSFTSSGSLSNLKRKLNSSPSKYYNKFEAFDKFAGFDCYKPLTLTPSSSQTNISTYYFKHSEPEHNQSPTQKLAINEDEISIPIPIQTSTPNKRTSTEQHFGLLDESQRKNVGIGNGDIDTALFSPEVDEDEEMDAEEKLGMSVGVGQGTALIIPLEKEIGELVQKAEELAKKSAQPLDILTSIHNHFYRHHRDENDDGGSSCGGGDYQRKTKTTSIGCATANINSGCGKRSNNNLRKCKSLSISASSSFASLKAKFSAMEEVLLETSSKVVPSVGGSGSGCGDGKRVKKSARVRQWVKEHNSKSTSAHNLCGGAGRKDGTRESKEKVGRQQGTKNASSCDASAESTSEDDGGSENSSSLSTDDPTTTSASISRAASTVLLQQTQAALCSLRNKTSLHSSSDKDKGLQVGVTLRSKKLLKTFSGLKQRPKSFTDAFTNSTTNGSVCSSQSHGCWVSSDTALNLLGGGVGTEPWGYQNPQHQTNSNNSNSDSSTSYKKKSAQRERVARKRLFRHKRKSTNDLSTNGGNGSPLGVQVARSTSFIGAVTLPVRPSDSEDKENCEKETESVVATNLNQNASSPLSQPRPVFQILGAVSQQQPTSIQTNSEIGSSMNTEQDWDSYQEKYLSEPYSEEPYDPNDTLKLLAFGEDYGQYLERVDSESSSVLSGFEPQIRRNQRKRLPPVIMNRNETPESDSDLEELHHLLNQSSVQLRYIEALFNNGQQLTSGSAELAEMEATCDENIRSLQLILANIEAQKESRSFDVDVPSVDKLLEKWHILKEKIKQASRLRQIRDEMDDLKTDFSSVHSHFEDVDPFDANDLKSLLHKIGHIQRMLQELGDRKQKLQSLNEASLGTHFLLKDTNAGGVIKEQLQELYALYEENFQLGSYLLERMRFLQEAWEKFETEKSEFERSISVGNLRTKLRKELSSAASTDSGHGTDASHDSSVSDSDLDFQEKKQKLTALKNRAIEIKSFLPPGSPVMDVIEQRVYEAEKGLEDLRRSTEIEKPFTNLKIIYPKKKSPVVNRRNSTGNNFSKELRSSSSAKRRTPTPTLVTTNKPRKWKVVRRMVVFNFALMGLFLAAAYFLHPNCCEYKNTFCFSLVPHLTHESLPPI